MKLGRCSTVSVRPATSVLAVFAFAIVLDVVVEARTPNRPVEDVLHSDAVLHSEAVLHSGDVFPEVFVWKSILTPVLTSPGRYWLAYSMWLFGFFIRSVYIAQSEGNRQHFQFSILVARIGDAIAGLTVAFSTVDSDTIAEFSVIYLIGLCYIQTFVEAARADGTIARTNLYDGCSKAITIWVLCWTVTSLSVLHISYGPLEHLSLWYIGANFFIIAPLAAASNFSGEEYDPQERGNSTRHFLGFPRRDNPQQDGETRRAYREGKRRWLGMAASLPQFGFCTAAVLLTLKIDGIPHGVTIAFYVTTAVIACISNFVRANCHDYCERFYLRFVCSP